MYGLETITPGLRRVLLPRVPGVDGPWGQVANVWVLGEQEPVLVDCGHRALRPNLLAALADAGVEPAAVSKVLLTSLRPECAGNVDAFPNATLHVHDPAGLALDPVALGRDTAAACYRAARDIVDAGVGDGAWPGIDLAAQQRGYDQLSEHIPVLPVRDAEQVVTTVGTFEAMATPGAHPTGTSWRHVREGWLFGGHALVLRADPVWDDVRALTASITRVVQSNPCWVLPSVGEIERNPALLFRSLSLTLNNLLTNLPSALDEDRSPVEIAWRDLGFWPRDLVRFAAGAQRYALVLNELVASGIAVRDGDSVVSRHSLGATDRPARRPTRP